MGGNRVARERRPVDEEHPVAPACQEHRGRCPGASRPDHDGVVDVVRHDVTCRSVGTEGVVDHEEPTAVGLPSQEVEPAEELGRWAGAVHLGRPAVRPSAGDPPEGADEGQVPGLHAVARLGGHPAERLVLLEALSDLRMTGCGVRTGPGNECCVGLVRAQQDFDVPRVERLHEVLVERLRLVPFMARPARLPDDIRSVKR